MEESTLLTTAVQPQPVKILLFNVRLIGCTHTTEEHCTCVKIRSEFKVAVSSVDKGQLTSIVTDRKTDFKILHWSVKLMVCMNVSPEILLIY